MAVVVFQIDVNNKINSSLLQKGFPLVVPFVIYTLCNVYYVWVYLMDVMNDEFRDEAACTHNNAIYTCPTKKIATTPFPGRFQTF